MTAQLRSELLKLRTTRTVALLLLGAAALTLFGACIEGLSPTLAPSWRREEHAALAARRRHHRGPVRDVRGPGRRHQRVPLRDDPPDAAGPAAPARRAGREARRDRARRRVFAAVCVALALGAGRAILAARGVDLALTGGETRRRRRHRRRERARRRLGVAVGALIRNQAGAIIARGRLRVRGRRGAVRRRPVRRALPARQGRRRARRTARRAPPRPGAGAAVLVAWTLAFVVAATVRNERSDV